MNEFELVVDFERATVDLFGEEGASKAFKWLANVLFKLRDGRNHREILVLTGSQASGKSAWVGLADSIVSKITETGFFPYDTALRRRVEGAHILVNHSPPRALAKRKTRSYFFSVERLLNATCTGSAVVDGDTETEVWTTLWAELRPAERASWSREINNYSVHSQIFKIALHMQCADEPPMPPSCSPFVHVLRVNELGEEATASLHTMEEQISATPVANARIVNIKQLLRGVYIKPTASLVLVYVCVVFKRMAMRARHRAWAPGERGALTLAQGFAEKAKRL